MLISQPYPKDLCNARAINVYLVKIITAQKKLGERMARVNLEERLFADDRLPHIGRCLLAAEMPLKAKALAIGTLAILWRTSQDEGKAEATKSEIAYWLDMDESSAAMDALLSHLVRANYLESCELGFRICGNGDQIAALLRWRERAKKGGEANRKRLRKKQTNDSNELNLQDNKGELEASHKLEHTDSHKLEHTASRKQEVNTTQFNSTQFNSKNSKSLATSNPETAPEEIGVGASAARGDLENGGAGEWNLATATDRVWDRYAETYHRKTGATPIRNGRQDRLIAQMIGRIGEADALEIAHSYFLSGDPYYGKRGWPLTLLLRDCEILAASWQRQREVWEE